MARPLRMEYEGALYHVTARGNERKKIYLNQTDYKQFLAYIKAAKEKYGILLHSYVLMGNHYHLLIETPSANLSKAMHHINSSHTMYMNRKRKRVGHLFQGRYKAIVIEKETYLVELSRYIHLNPVRARMVEKPEEYSYSSYKAYVSKDRDDIVTQDLILEMISRQKGDARNKYKTYVESAIGREIENPLKNVYGGMILGSNGFIKDMLKKIKKEVLKKGEISHRRALRALYEADDILNVISGYFKTSPDEIREKRKPEVKKIAIYLMKRHTGATNREIGEKMGGLSNAAVAKIYQRFRKDIKAHRKLRNTVAKVETKLSFVKG